MFGQSENSPNTALSRPVQGFINHVKWSTDHIRSRLDAVVAAGCRTGRGSVQTLWRARLSEHRSRSSNNYLPPIISRRNLYGHVANVESICSAEFHLERTRNAGARFFLVGIVRT